MQSKEGFQPSMEPKSVTEHLLRKASVTGLDKDLGNVPERALESALIEVYAVRADKLTQQQVINQYETNAFTNSSELSQREIINFEAAVLDVLPVEIDLVELSPVTAFGANSVMSNISQKTVLTTSRNTEVVADGVTSLTLEAAKRHRSDKASNGRYNLGTFHRELRTQKHEQPGFTSHFHALSLVKSSMESQPDLFKSESFTEQIGIYLSIIQGINDGLGYEARDLSVALSNIRIAGLLIKNLGLDRGAIMRHTQIPDFNLFDEYSIPLDKYVAVDKLKDLSDSLPAELTFLRRPILYMGEIFANLTETLNEVWGEKVNVYFDLSRHAGVGYYQDLCAKISATNSRDENYPLVDIGTNDWFAKILNNRNARLMTGGMGTELFMKKFKK